MLGGVTQTHMYVSIPKTPAKPMHARFEKRRFGEYRNGDYRAVEPRVNNMYVCWGWFGSCQG